MAADVSFRIGAELTEIKAALTGLRRDFASLGKAANDAGGASAFKGIQSGAAGALGAVGRLAAGFVGLAGTIKLIAAADELNTLNARIRLVTNGTEEYNRAQSALFDLAQRTRTGLGETVKLYAQIANATKDAKVGQEVLLDVVETVNQAVQLSGASTQAAEAALVQLGQGLASGTLRGEELNSVLEQTPALADAIAKGMGITRGQLRQYGEDGKISAEQVIKALQAQKAEVAKQFAELPLTVGQATTLLKNAGLQLLGTFDQASGATSGLSGALKTFADFVSSDAVAGQVAAFGEVVRQAFSLAGEAFEGLLVIGDFVLQTLGDVFRAQFGQALAEVEGLSDGLFKLPRTGKEVVDLVVRAFRELPANLKALVRVIVVEAVSQFDELISSAQTVKEVLAAVFNDDTIAAARQRGAQRSAAIRDAREQTIADILATRDAEIGAINAVQKATEAARAKARSFQGSRAPGRFTSTPSDKERREAEAAAKALLDAEEKLQKDSAQRQLQTLRDLYEDGVLAAQQYYARRQELELDALDASLATERKRLAGATNEADRIKARTEIELLERQRLDVVTKSAREAAQAQRDIDRETAQLRAQDLENQGRLEAASRIRLAAQYEDLLKKLGRDSEAAKLVQKLIDTGVAKARFDELQKIIQERLAQLERQLAANREGVRTGALTPQEGLQADQAAREQALAGTRAATDELGALAQQIGDPALVESADRVAQAIAGIGAAAQPTIEIIKGELRLALEDMQANLERSTVNAGVDAMTTFFTDIATGAKSGKEALLDFVRSFAASMAQIAARALATFLVLQLLDAIYPGLGKATAASMAAGAGDKSASVFHSGGVVGRGGTRRQVPAIAFAGAPRYHSGGMVGLKPDEVPAILQTGERVLSRQEVAAGAGGGGQGVRVINVVDPNLLQDYMSTPAGEKVLVNAIRRNRGAVRQELG